jgi:hypothetical protein
MPIKWSKIDRLGLAYYIDREVRELLPLQLNLLDLQMEADGNRKIAETIYNALLAKEIQYALEPRTSSKPRPIQEIRVAPEILATRKEGTCHDLALLFSALCLAYELIPVLIILEGHALVAISLTHNTRSWDKRDINEDRLFQNALVTEENGEQLRTVFLSGAYLVIECTGFARSHSLSDSCPEGSGRGQDGTMSFERAVSAGLEQLQPEFRRPFRYALDIVVAHYFYELQPVSFRGAAARFQSFHSEAGALNLTANDGPLPYLLDRSEQEKEFRKGVLNHRAVAPRRPFVCVIHGDQYECHAEFVTRLREISIPRFFEYWYPNALESTPLMKYRVLLPPFGGNSLSEWEDMFWQELARGTLKNGTAARKQVVSFIAGHSRSVIIEIPILAERLEADPAENIASILEFWNRWPEMPEGLLLVICLSFKYQQKYEVRPWYRKLSKSLNQRIKSCLTETAWPYEGITTACLPELRAVAQSDVEDAINEEAVKDFYGLTERDVRGIYGQTALCTADGCITMDRLLMELTSLSKKRN